MVKKILKYLLILLLLVILICLSYIFLFNNKDKKNNQNQKMETNINIEKNIKSKQQIEQQATSSPILSYATTSPVLLSNEEKKKYGIDTDKPVYLEIIEGNMPRLILPPEMIASSSQEIDENKDTDHDGLPDLIEVEIYKTDPKNPDTDGDGYKDGDEVKNGFNPNGSGKL
ncbi:MAG: hypothetical protein ABIE46_02705 [Patescibacteria group bacterium]